MKATMRGGSGDDNIKGWLGRNGLVGNAGNDELQGRSRSDVLPVTTAVTTRAGEGRTRPGG